eukprot:TRINITY_DN25105_c0_g1_i1.p1 TRINITY_DN25105_c0_g1~~TRINITY_DN25105_c0_g1_i1.p1  ORF type:complete len:615 (-),score=119.73 TRINITY_DN25105_c0_g1_i1:19-1863(-)
MISSKSKKYNINGIEYPREVPAPEGFPPGWVGIEQAYGEKSKYHGQTYTRYSSLDGKYRLVLNAKGVIEKHCDDNGLDFETEFAKYEKAKAERIERRKEIAAKEAEARGLAKGQVREDMIAVSRQHFGELKGDIVFGFPGWRCRWDLLPDSGQTPKTFTDPDGNEFKLLKDLECKLGTKITQNGGVVPAEMEEMVKAGKNNTEARALFHTGSQKARESGGSVELNAWSSEVQTQTAEERLRWKLEREAERSRLGSGKRLKPRKFFHPVTPSDYNSWNVMLSFPSDSSDTSPDLQGLVALLSSRGFSKKSSLLHVASTGQTEHRYAKALVGLYCLKGKDEESGRPCYQGVAASSKVAGAVVALDRYIYWSARHERWEMGTMKTNKACIAFALGECAAPDEAKPWCLLRADFGSEAPSAAPSILPVSEVKSEPSSNEAPKTPREEVSKKAKHEPPKTPKEEVQVSKKAKHEAVKTPEVAAQKKVGASPKDASVNSAASVSSSGSAAVSKEASASADSGVYHTERIWGYEERTTRRGSDLTERPKHWPEDVEIAQGPWNPWLPSDWGQCKAVTDGGRTVTKFVSPEGFIVSTRSEVERKVGRKLEGIWCLRKAEPSC